LSENGRITWREDKRRLGDLIPWPINPAQIKEPEARRLLESLEEFGQVQALAISPDNEIYDGHQRQLVWGAAEKYGKDYEVDVRVSSRKLTEDERKKLVIYLRKGAVGEFDFDVLANNWEVDDLLDWGFEGYEIGIAPDDSEWTDAFGALPDEDRAPFQQMTFTLHDDQVEQVKEAMRVSKSQGEFVDTGNENSNGNALARVCEMFIGDYGQG
jgi:hypothetical protein